MLENSGSLVAERYNNSGSRPDSATASADTGVWTQITVVHTTNSTQLYVDGNLISTQASTYSLAEIFADTNNDAVFQIGKANWGNGEFFKGWLDDFTIANYAMTQEEVEELSGKSSAYTGILNRVGEGVPVVVNRALYANESNSVTFRKLGAALMQSTSSGVFGSSDMEGKTLQALSLQDMTSSMVNANTYVEGNVFVYDESGKGGVVSGNFHNGSFFSDSEIEQGFTAVLDEIENENFYLEVAGKQDRIDEVVTMATAIRHIINFGDRRNVTKTSLRVLDLEPYDFEDYYSGGSDPNITTAYNDIKTVDDNPDTDDSLGVSVDVIESDSICLSDGKIDKKWWIIDNIAPQFEDNLDDLEVTIMGTKEFIGKLDDLNTEYDLIYLGLDTSIMNTKIITNADGSRTKTDDTVYNDSSMDGLVYAHVGDALPIDSDREYIHGTYRLSGNDITFDKLRELKEYIEAGYAVILSDGFLVQEGSTYKVNTHLIDSSSNMYKLINDTVLATENGAYRYYGKNVNSKSSFIDSAENVVSTRENFSKYLGISKLLLKYSDADLPVAYNQPDGSQRYLSPDSDGVYRLHFNMELQNDSAVGLASTSYDAQLYVDIDADGRFEDIEKLTGLNINDGNGNSYQPDSSGRYHLKTGAKYSISREIPEGYTGFLAWKLVFEMNDKTFAGSDEKSAVRSAVSGYSAVPVSGVKPVIRVLQITTHDPPTEDDDQTTLNLDDAEMHALYDAVQDFDIEVDLIPSSRYVDKQSTLYAEGETYSEFLKKYDMVVMGFKDMYLLGYGVDVDYLPTGEKLTKEHVIEAVLAIREYALSGRSMMFTHDLNSPRVDASLSTRGERRWGWYANQLLRDVQGMDRFGVLTSSTLIPEDEKYNYQSKYDTPLLEGNSVEDSGLASSVLINRDYKTTDESLAYSYGENARRATWLYGTHLNYHRESSWRGASTVSQVNSGQITEYPYNIDETFDATHSHPQYLQLNMDTDSRDENNNDDIVVWYSLSKIDWWKDSYFAANEMDVRNNFFIYNKGNITYTGSGDSEVTNDMERKLFVNTLVASYRSGTHAPKTLFKESEWESSATITSTYLPYDPEMNSGVGGFLKDALPVNFKVTNMDLQKSDDPIYVKYYVDGSQSDYTIYVDGKYYKEITPVSAYKLVEQDGNIIKESESTDIISNNSMHQLSFSYESLGLMASREGIRNKHTTNIYVRLGYDAMEETGEISLPATESITGLNIVCTQLFELK